MFVHVVKESDPIPAMPVEPALQTGYEPDRFQKFAIQGIEAGDNILVTAKTGSGKTFVGEYQIAKSLKEGKRVFYTTPIKSLSNQKFHDLKKLFPDASVGIMTGDIKFIPDAQIVVMTTEILRNALFKRGSSTEKIGLSSLIDIDNVDSVVFDEVHYINDKDRGHVWEECLILLPPRIHLILLSATLTNPYIFANWLGTLKQKKIWLISTLWRAVPLEHCILGNDSTPIVIYDKKETFHSDVYKGWLSARKGEANAHDAFQKKVKDARRSGHEGPVSGKIHIKSFEHTLNETLSWLHTHVGLPAIVFCFSRKGCEYLASKVTTSFLDTSDSAAVAHIWDFHLSRYKPVLEKSPQMHRLRELAMRGIAFHHSGLLPFLKEILEILFSKGYVKVLMATETFAVGINMPTKTVIFTSLEKYTDGGFRPLASSEYIQMAGRAGRRGKDEKGLVLYIPEKDPLDTFEIQAMMTGRAASFHSRMTFHYDFIMKSLNGGVNRETLVKNSYWWALEQEDLRVLESDIAICQKEINAFSLTDEERKTCDERKELEDTISTTQNSKKKQATRALDAWKQTHKDSVWKPIYDTYQSLLHKDKQLETLCNIRKKYILMSTHFDTHALPLVSLRLKILEEYGYVKDGEATQSGILASEVNEGHSFLLTEFMLRMHDNCSLTLDDFLIVLATFVGEGKESIGEWPTDAVYKEVMKIQGDAKEGVEKERRLGIDSPEFWDISTEWIEPIACWLRDEDSVASLGAKFELFEGNVLKALLKLASLLEEVQAMASVLKNTSLLEMLSGGRNRILRDVVLAESLYLRL
jgi:superfamily II RNA helicase